LKIGYPVPHSIHWLIIDWDPSFKHTRNALRARLGGLTTTASKCLGLSTQFWALRPWPNYWTKLQEQAGLSASPSW
jgi:hypothetical protein